MNTLLTTLTPLALTGSLALASEPIVDVDARVDCVHRDLMARSNVGQTLFLEAGAYYIEYVDPNHGGLFTAANKWGGSHSGCDENGGSCTTGWRTSGNLMVYAPSFLTVYEQCGSGTWQTPELAFMNAVDYFFVNPEPGEVRFAFSDGVCGDNVGGQSFRLVLNETLSDIDFDGNVDVGDLLLLLGSWGDCDCRIACTADLNGDQRVGFEDVLVLLAAWS